MCGGSVVRANKRLCLGEKVHEVSVLARRHLQLLLTLIDGALQRLDLLLELLLSAAAVARARRGWLAHRVVARGLLFALLCAVSVLL